MSAGDTDDKPVEGCLADPASTHVVQQLKHAHPLLACRFDPSGQFVFTSSIDNTVQRFCLADGQQTTLTGHSSWVRAIDFRPSTEQLITGDCHGRLLFWPALEDAPQPIRTIAAHQGWVRSISVSSDGQLLATGGSDRLVRLWTGEGQPVATFSGHEADVYCTMFHPGGEFLLSGDLAGKVKQWRIDSGELIRTLEVKVLHSYNSRSQGIHYGGIRSITLSADGKHLACSGLHKPSNPLGAVNEPIVVALDWQQGKPMQSHVTSDVIGVACRAIYHKSGFLVAASGGNSGGFLLFFRGEDEKEFFKFKLPDTVRDLDLHPDGLQLATAHHDGHVRISRLQPDEQSPS